MTRWFYPAYRAHHAYSMCLDHGLMFEKRNGFWSLEGLREIHPDSSYKLVVAKECEHLLQPQAGDVFTTADFPGPDLCRVISVDGDHVEYESVTGPGWCTRLNGFARIIQRDGNPFAMPEWGEP